MTRRLAVATLATAAVLVGAAPAGAAPTTGLAAHWSFNEGSGVTANDDSGNANTGTLQGGVTWTTGIRSNALRFDGSGSVRAASSTSLEPTAVTVSAWVKNAGSPGSFKYIVAKGATACVAAAYGLYTGPNGGLMFYVSSAGGTAYTQSADAGTGVWDGAWHLVAGTFDGTALRLYVDGSEVGSAQTAGPVDYGTLDSRDLFIGRYPGCSGLDFSGSIDDARIYGRALSSAEIQLLPLYQFTGFYQPVDNYPVVNVTKAGSAIPVKFSLGGDQGLGIFPAGTPTSQPVACDNSEPSDAIEQTVTAGSSSLQYDSLTGIYTYVWKTDKAWAATCRTLKVSFDDGTSQTAAFKFTK